MAGSTSDEQSVFDTPTDLNNTQSTSLFEHSPTSAASTPDQTQQTTEPTSDQARDQARDAGRDASTTDNQAPSANWKQKRIACIICRKRKLKCDGARPSCSTCTRLRHDCGYDETRKKSGPKRGYVKHLEQRLRQIEDQLKTDGGSAQDPSSALNSGLHGRGFDTSASPMTSGLLGLGNNSSTLCSGDVDNQEGSQGYPWEMIGLGLEEPLPPNDVVNELHSIYFEKLHSSMPMIHKYRYLAATELSPSMRPPVTLRYAIWCYASSASDKHLNLQEIFYQRARKYAEIDETKGFGERVLTIGHVQAWIIIANYEFKTLYFTKAWMSVGRAVRLAQMLGLHRVDGEGLEVKQCLAPPKDWVDREERRRTFWAAFCFDRWASIGTGWPVVVDERDIHTNLPVSDNAFDTSREEEGQSLAAILRGAKSPAYLSSYSSVILMASIIGKTLTHLHRTDGREGTKDVQSGDFWKRHQYLDHILTNTTACLPDHLRLVPGMTDPNVVFLHMHIHSTGICLHQAAILRAEQNNLDASLIKRSTDSCRNSAGEIANIWRTVSHLDISYLSPYLAFCLYVAARVFVQAYKKEPNDEEVRRGLHFLLNAMDQHRKRNDITESFLMQLVDDLRSTGFDNAVLKRYASVLTKRGAYSAYQQDLEDKVCVPIMAGTKRPPPAYTYDKNSSGEIHEFSANYTPSSNIDGASNSAPVQLDARLGPDSGSTNFGMANQRPLPGGQLHSVSLGHDYDISVQYAQQQSVPANNQASSYSTQVPFILPTQHAANASNSSGSHNGSGMMQGQATHGQQGQFYNSQFDINMLGDTFEFGQDGNMMEDIPSASAWTQNGNTVLPHGIQSTPAAAWADFI